MSAHQRPLANARTQGLRTSECAVSLASWSLGQKRPTVQLSRWLLLQSGSLLQKDFLLVKQFDARPNAGRIARSGFNRTDWFKVWLAVCVVYAVAPALCAYVFFVSDEVVWSGIRYRKRRGKVFRVV